MAPPLSFTSGQRLLCRLLMTADGEIVPRLMESAFSGVWHHSATGGEMRGALMSIALGSILGANASGWIHPPSTRKKMFSFVFGRGSPLSTAKWMPKDAHQFSERRFGLWLLLRMLHLGASPPIEALEVVSSVLGARTLMHKGAQRSSVAHSRIDSVLALECLSHMMRGLGEGALALQLGDSRTSTFDVGGRLHFLSKSLQRTTSRDSSAPCTRTEAAIVEPIFTCILANGHLGRTGALLASPWGPPKGEVGVALLLLSALAERHELPAFVVESLCETTGSQPTHSEAWSNMCWTLAMDEQLVRLMQAGGSRTPPDQASQEELMTRVREDPLNYPLLVECDAAPLYVRSRLLVEFNRTLLKCLIRWATVQRRSVGDVQGGAQGLVGLLVLQVRGLIFTREKQKVWKAALMRQRDHGDGAFEAKFSRPEAAQAAALAEIAMKAGRPHPATLPPKGAGGRARKLTLFEQLLELLEAQSATSELSSGDGTVLEAFCPLICGADARAFHVTFEGEGASDAGGPYREVLSNLAMEVQSMALPLLIPTPNKTQPLAADRNKFTINPSAVGPRCRRMFQLLGALIGLAMRSNHPLAFELPIYVWKLIIGETPTLSDLARSDLCTANLLHSLRHNNDPNFRSLDAASWNEAVGETLGLAFIFHRSDGVTVPLCHEGGEVPVTYDTRTSWCEAVERLRHEECADQVAAIRAGLETVVSLDGLVLFSAEEVETLACGESDWAVAFLRAHTEMQLPRQDRRVEWLWEALESFTKEERAKFLQFVWGRSRMPEHMQSKMVVNDDYHSRHDGNPNQFLPTSATCSFALHLPQYTEAAILRERLLYAINHGRTIDLDHEADASAWLADDDDRHDDTNSNDDSDRDGDAPWQTMEHARGRQMSDMI